MASGKIGGALLFPATLALLNTTFAEGPVRNRALAVWGAAGAAGGAFGTLLGGVLTSAFGWEWTFYVNVPVAIGAAVLALRLLPPDGASVTRRRFDMPGALAITAGVTLLVLAIIEAPERGWSSPETVAVELGAALLLALFAIIELRSDDPLIPLRLLRNRSLRAATLIAFVFMATFGAQFYTFTVYLQDVLGYEALLAGCAFLPFLLAIVVGTQVGERLTTRVDARFALLSGLAIGAVGMLVVAAGVSTTDSLWSVLPGMLVDGAGQGILWTVIWIAAAAGVRADQQGIASGIASTSQQVGGAVGLAFLVAIMNAGIGSSEGLAHRQALADGVQLAFLVSAGTVAVGAVAGWWLLRTERPRTSPAASVAP